MKNLFFLLCLFILQSCSSTNYYGASNYSLEWKDFHSPRSEGHVLETAITPEFYYESGGNTSNGIHRNLVGGYLGASALLNDQFVFGLGAGYRGGNVKIYENTNSLPPASYSTSAFQANTSIGYKIEQFDHSFYPIIVGINYGTDSGDYLDFRKELYTQITNNDSVIDTGNLFSFYAGTKKIYSLDEGYVSLMGGVLFLDQSTSEVFNSGEIGLIGNAAFGFKDYILNFRGSTGKYGGASIGGGYRIQ